MALGGIRWPPRWASSDADRELLVLADNRFNSTTAPLHTGGDFWHYGGLMRSVALHELRPKTSVTLPWVWRAYALPSDAALDAVNEGGIDLAVLDISMPGLNGVEVAEAIRGDALTKDTLILMVSASVQLLTDHGVVANRSDSFIVKPFSPRVLSDRIRSMLGLGEPA